MTLKIIGPGFGRTGTKSTKDALEILGFAPCHHMFEVFGNPPQVKFWQAFAEGKDVDFREVFAGYQAQIDWPGAHAWRELVQTFPEAKVLLTVRPEESWYRSYSRTIGKFMKVYKDLELPPHIRDMADTMTEMVVIPTFGGVEHSKQAALDAYRKRIEEVRAEIAPERLLVFDVAEGWDALCSFLEVPVPDTPFPHQNRREDFWEAMGGEPSDP
ncbi:MAG: sulfotransferase [Roseobacter sp.]